MKKQTINLIGRLALTGALTAGALGTAGCLKEKETDPVKILESISKENTGLTIYFNKGERFQGIVADIDGDNSVDLIGTYGETRAHKKGYERFSNTKNSVEMTPEIQKLADEYLAKGRKLSSAIYLESIKPWNIK